MTAYDKVTIVGAGLLGHALGLVHALGGCNVVLQDISEERLAWAKNRLPALLDDLVAYGLVETETAEAALSRIGTNADLREAVADADLVVEAIIEDAEAKQRLYSDLEPMLHEGAVLASNTSFLDVFPLVPRSLRPRSLIVHWYTPPYLIDLVDVVPSPEAGQEVANKMVGFLRDIGKKPVLLKKFVPGYIANNIQMAIESEVFRLLDEGVAEISDIDDALRFGLSQRLSLMGQFKKIDYTGLQVVRDIHATGLYTPPRKPTGTPVLDERLARGSSGVMAGSGFYDYGDTDAQELFRRRDSKLARLKLLLSEFEDDL
ncbi:3-hydroxyacyl-CoA dehydrogenase family protein [uncultured Roseibium sp.]|uniref:3-hydroxyacyl-CoA dehydrogenase family protein n=1 Tax=uncultured Roseibium sp. TaxID=1936171 RepID=UPI00261D3349|nr:3-hydroxyacyl-CoA dehydrogenase family protein [uncultured Roseibium sp.]